MCPGKLKEIGQSSGCPLNPPNPSQNWYLSHVERDHPMWIKVISKNNKHGFPSVNYELLPKTYSFYSGVKFLSKKYKNAKQFIKL
jgi:hypothetical protein